MLTWAAADAAALARPQEVQVATRRRDGSLRRARTIWIVGEDTTVHIRSTNGRGADWFRAALSGGTGQVTAGGRTFEVSFHEVGDNEAALARVDAAYRAKYGRYSSIVDHLEGPGPRAATLRLEPAPVGHPEPRGEGILQP